MKLKSPLKGVKEIFINTGHLSDSLAPILYTLNFLLPGETIKTMELGVSDKGMTPIRFTVNKKKEVLTNTSG
jgi:hypothetical protein